VRHCKLNECAIDFKNHTNMMQVCRTYLGKGWGPRFCKTDAVHTFPFVDCNLDAVCFLVLIFHVPLSRISDKGHGKDDILTNSGRGGEGAKRVSWMSDYSGSESVLSGLEWATHVHSEPLDLEWKNCAMISVKRSKMNI
jgi:hypothetical protein